MKKTTTAQPPRNHPEGGRKLSEIRDVTTVTSYSPTIDQGAKSDVGDNNRKKVVTAVAGTQKWGPGGCVQVGHPKPAKRFVQLNEEGHRIGEDHPGAKLSDEAVEAIRDEYEAGIEGAGPRIGYRRLAKKWGVPKTTIRGILKYEKRNQWPAKWKRIA